MESKTIRKPNIEKPWLKYYDKKILDSLYVPECTLREYMKMNMPGLDVTAIDYYGNEIKWGDFFDNVDKTARSLKALGFKENDQVPVFMKSVPEFLVLLFACEKIGASLVNREHELYENADTLRKSGSKVLFANDCLSQEAMNYYLEHSDVEKIVLSPLLNSCKYEDLPDYVKVSYDNLFASESAHGDNTMSWDEFIEAGKNYDGKVEAETDINRPLFRAYTSGSTGPAKQVIHSAHSVIGALAQMNFYGSVEGIRPTWLVAALPPCMVSIIISFFLLPLSSNKILILSPLCDEYDIDLEFMRCKPNCWPTIPMFCDILSHSKRLPDDFDISFLYSCGAGCEHMNNTQLFSFQKFLNDHNCNILFTTGYGSSEAGSNIGFHISGHPLGNGNVGVPMPLTNVAICRFGTFEELGYEEVGEICIQSPNLMLGYDNPEATAKSLKLHPDGKIWLHTGDVGHFTEDGVLYVNSRGSSREYNGQYLDLLPMENAVSDAKIPEIVDHFFVNVPDQEHKGYYIPYLYVSLKDGIKLDDIKDQVTKLCPSSVVIKHVNRRPYWHFKTYRIGMIRNVLGQDDSLEVIYPENMA